MSHNEVLSKHLEALEYGLRRGIETQNVLSRHLFQIEPNGVEIDSRLLRFLLYGRVLSICDRGNWK